MGNFQSSRNLNGSDLYPMMSPSNSVLGAPQKPYQKSGMYNQMDY